MSNPEETNSPLESFDVPIPASVVEILKGFNILKSEALEELHEDKSTAEAFLTFVQKSNNVLLCVNQLFPNGIPLDQSFFTRLNEIRKHLGYFDICDEAIGIVWSEAMNRLDADQKQHLLEIFAAQQGHDFFENVGSLYIIVKDHSFSPNFLADWFTEIVRAVEGDIAADVWETIRACCQYRIECALEVVLMLTTPPEERRLSIAGVMLGTLRSMTLSETQCREFERTEKLFESHTNDDIRSVFNWSWVTTARINGITDPQICSLFARADVGNSSSDISCIISVICCICTNDKLSSEQFILCLNWINENINSSLTSAAKYYLSHTAYQLTRAKSNDDQLKVNYPSWIIGIQPVSQEDKGTWREIELYLCNLLKFDKDAFCVVFEGLCSTNAVTLNEIIQKPRSFELLLREMQTFDIDEMVGRLAMSPDTPTRKLGLFLFDELNIESLPDESFTQYGDLGTRLLFFEIQRTMLNSQSLARLLVSLLNHTDHMDEIFKEILVEEIKLQSRNYAGSFRQELEERGRDLEIIREVIEDARKYFENLNRAHEAGINAMEVAGHRRAAILQHRRFSQEVSKSATEYSTVLRMMKKVNQLYGRESSTYVEGNLQDAIPLVHHSSSMEIPIVDFCDPEEMALRRLHATKAIHNLLEDHGLTTEH